VLTQYLPEVGASEIASPTSPQNRSSPSESAQEGLSDTDKELTSTLPGYLAHRVPNTVKELTIPRCARE